MTVDPDIEIGADQPWHEEVTSCPIFILMLTSRFAGTEGEDQLRLAISLNKHIVALRMTPDVEVPPELVAYQGPVAWIEYGPEMWTVFGRALRRWKIADQFGEFKGIVHSDYTERRKYTNDTHMSDIR